MQHNDPKARILHLSLKKAPFDVMVTGEKWQEYRKLTEWIVSRLYSDWEEGTRKDYDFIKFVNGYGADKPYFICKYNGFQVCTNPIGPITYSNGFVMPGIDECDFIIYCGPIVETGNLKSK